MTNQIAVLFLILAVVIGRSSAFTLRSTPNVKFGHLPPTTSLDMTVLSYNGKKKDFKPGTPLSKAVAALGVKPTYSCKKGDCATCEIFLAGRLTKPCVAKVPPEPKLKSLQEKGLEIRM
jgi:ferredoxin